MSKSHLEAKFTRLLHLQNTLKYVTEYRFHPHRRWAFDFAWPEQRVAVEIEGGVWTRGRHTRGSGYIEDTEKYNAAALLGWTVLRFTEQQIDDGTAIQQTLEALHGTD